MRPRFGEIDFWGLNYHLAYAGRRGAIGDEAGRAVPVYVVCGQPLETVSL
jgi:hypothetical protein